MLELSESKLFKITLFHWNKSIFVISRLLIKNDLFQ